MTNPDQFRNTLARVRERGWSLVSEEREIGLITASAPIRNHAGQVIAALSSSTSTGRMSPERVERDLVPVLVRIADEISVELGA